MKCFVARNQHPYIRLGPSKVQMLSTDPSRFIVHELLSEAEIDTLTRTFKNKLTYQTSSPLLVNPSSGKKDIRGGKAATVKFSNLHLNNNVTSKNMMNTISKRLEMITLFNLTEYGSITEYRISLNGLGSLVESHDDSYLVEKSNQTLHDKYSFRLQHGDIVATILVWLTNVEGGGGTFFSSHGNEQLAVPVRGSALLWINLKSSGDICLKQTHGGCPVSKGNKLVLGAWVNHYSQWNTLPCDLDSEMKIELRQISAELY